MDLATLLQLHDSYVYMSKANSCHVQNLYALFPGARKRHRTLSTDMKGMILHISAMRKSKHYCCAFHLKSEYGLIHSLFYKESSMWLVGKLNTKDQKIICMQSLRYDAKCIFFVKEQLLKITIFFIAYSFSFQKGISIKYFTDFISKFSYTSFL